MPAEVTIDHRFCGPPGTANGGYACAMVAQWLDGPAEVTLKVPPPLDRVLTVEHDEEHARLLDGDVLVAEARRTTIELEVPDPVSADEAARAASRYPWRADHPYPTCFVCGPDREAGDGLRIFPGPVSDRELFAADWTPDQALADASGAVGAEFVWGALDCPSGIVTDRFADVGRILLGRLAADLRRPVAAGEPHVVTAWTLARDGRKLHTASALHTAAGELCAVARAVWIEVAPPATA